MKLKRLLGLVHDSLREEVWTPEPIGLDPFLMVRPRSVITVDLITGYVAPPGSGDVERFYRGMSIWFLAACEKEGIPIGTIASAVLTISPTGKECVVRAGGREFSATKPFR